MVNPINPENTSTLLTTRRIESLWNVLGKFDINKADKKLDKTEISIFNEKIKSAMGSDGELSAEELNKLAKELNVSSEDLKEAITIVGADVLADNIYAVEHGPFFERADTTKNKMLEQLKYINKNNVVEVFQYFNEAHSRGRGVSHLSVALQKTITNQAELNKQYDRLEQMLVQRAEELNLDLSYLDEQYHNGKGTKSDILIDMARQLSLNNEGTARARYRTNTEGSYAIRTADKKQMMSTAQKYGLEPTDDLYGNGILGDSPSVALSSDAAKILKVVNKMLADPDKASRLRSCVVKYKNYLAVTEFDRNTVNTAPETNLIPYTDPKSKDRSTIGDGDMTIFVHFIQTSLRSDNKSVSKMSEEDLERYIIRFYKRTYGF